MSKYENIRILSLAMSVISVWFHGGELGTKTDFLSHENIPAAGFIPLALTAGHQISYDNDSVALLELVGELFDVEVIFL